MSERDHSKLQQWKCVYLDKLQQIFNEVEESYKKALVNADEGEMYDGESIVNVQM